MKLNTLEKFLLIAQNPDNGPFVTDIDIKFGLIAAALIELYINKRINLNKKNLVLVNNEDLDVIVASEVLSKIRKSKKSRNVKWWLDKLILNSGEYQQMVFQQLSDKGLIRIENKRFLWLFSSQDFYLINKLERENIIDRLNEDVLCKRKLNDEDIFLVGLINYCKLVEYNSFGENDLKLYIKNLKCMILESSVSEIIKAVAQEIRNAININSHKGKVQLGNLGPT